MTLDEAKKVIQTFEPYLDARPVVHTHQFERDERKLNVSITRRLKKLCQRQHVWLSKEFLQAFKNCEHGFDRNQSRRRGGKDGIFVIDRSFSPPNNMMRKVFERFLDKPSAGSDEIAMHLGTTVQNLIAVRVVAHHGRLLGVLHSTEEIDELVLIDWDDTK